MLVSDGVDRKRADDFPKLVDDQRVLRLPI